MAKRIIDPRPIFIVALMFTLLFAVQHANAQQLSQTEQIRIVCAASLLWIAGHEAALPHDKEKFLRSAVWFMQRIPSNKHPVIDLVLGELATAAYSEVYKAASNCHSAVPR